MKKERSKEKIKKEGAGMLSGKRPYLWIALTAFIIYLPTLSFGFSPMDEVWVFLDKLELYTNPANLPHLFSEAAVNDYYRPMWTASLMIDASLAGGQAWMFHLSNVLIHVCCCLLFYRILLEMQVKKNIAFLLALLFSAHTLNVHAVAWIPGRNDSLLGLFVLSAFLCVLLFRTSEKKQWAVASCIFLAGALFTKETAIVLPFMLGFFILHFIPAEKRKVFYSLLFSWIGITIFWFFLRRSIVPSYPRFTSLDLSVIVPDIFQGLVMQMGKFFLPLGLSVMPTVHDSFMLLFFIALALALILILRAGTKQRSISFFGLEWFGLFIAIPLVFGSLNGNWEHYEHRMYVPSFGLFLLLSQLDLERFAFAKQKNALLYFGAAVFLFFSTATLIRSRVYKDELSYALAGAKEAPNRPVFYDILGEHYNQKMEYPTALDYFNKYLEMNTNKGIVYFHRGVSYLYLKQPAKALVDFKKACAMEPDRPDFIENRAFAYYYLGALDSAMADVQLLSKGKYKMADWFIRDFGKAWDKKQELNSIEYWNKALASDTATAYSYNERGRIYFGKQKYPEALSDFAKAIQMNGKNLDYFFNRAVIYETIGKIDSAYIDFKHCYDNGYNINKEVLDEMKARLDAGTMR